MSKLRPGMSCLFDPYNVLNTKDTYNGTYAIKILKVYKRFGKPIYADCISDQTHQVFKKVPVKILYEIEPRQDIVIEIRNPPEAPVITEYDLKLLDYLANDPDNKACRSNIILLKSKLEFYKTAELYNELILQN